jgi:MoxR-like ATPase
MIPPNSFEPPPEAENGAYVYPPELVRAIRVALATDRPLLLRGKPGTGKTTVAVDVARLLGANYYAEVVTSRTEARDLQWRFDAVLRLAEAQIQGHRDRVEVAANYVEPRALWWAFDPDDAKKRGGGAQVDAVDPIKDGSRATVPAVMLVDEIDKAEPEVANDLLEPFDGRGFTVAETGHPVKPQRAGVLLIVTTNDERDLPAAFLRRCIVHELRAPGAEALTRIARSHFGKTFDAALIKRVIERVDTLAKEAEVLKLRAPGIAEFIDAIRAIQRMPTQDPTEWDAITRLAMWKHGENKAPA